jgi:capsular exopolysaccharide synthesis family protein
MPTLIEPRSEPSAAGAVPPTSELEAFLGVLARGKWVILLIALAGVVATAVSVYAQAKIYRATTLLQVSVPATSNLQADQVVASKALATTYARRLTDQGFLTWAARKLPAGTTADLSARLSVSVLLDTQLIELSVTARSPAEARMLAERLAELGVADIRVDSDANTRTATDALRVDANQLTARISRALGKLRTARQAGQAQTANALREQIDTLGQQRTDINTAIATVETQGLQQATSVWQPHSATASATPVSPRPVFDIALGLFFSLVIGLLAAWIRDQLDRRIRSLHEIESISGRPVLATVPLIRGGPSESHRGLANAYDVLRVNLTLATEEGVPPELLAITSGQDGEGKTFTAIGLGASLARAGRRALVVDTDFRRRGLSQHYEVSEKAGLANVLRGEDALEAVIVHRDDFDLLPAGHDQSPASLLDSRQFEDLLIELRNLYDVVVFDTPPLRQVADAALVAVRCDAVLLVARVGAAQRSAFGASVETLSSSPFTFLGTVAFQAEAGEERYRYEPIPRAPSPAPS